MNREEMPTLAPGAPEVDDANAQGQSAPNFRSLTPPSLRWRELLGEDIMRWPVPSDAPPR